MFDSAVQPPLRPGPRSASRPQSLRAAAPAIVALSLAMLVEMVDNSVLNVALPTIGANLETGTTGLQWIVSAYSLTFGGLLLVGGSLGDRLGRRRTLLWGLVGFGLSGAMVLLVHSTWQLVAVRAASGAFAAMIAPGTMSLLFRIFDDSTLRARAISLIVIVSMVGFAIGPALSGLVIEHVRWQFLLLANAPAALIAWIGVHCGIPSDPPDDLRPGSADVPGGILSVVSIAALLYGFTGAVEHGWTGVTTLLSLAAAGLAGAGFIVRERRIAEPMLDLTIFSRATVRGSAILQAASMLCMVGVAFAATQIFQFAWEWTPLQAGIATSPLVLGMLVATPVSDLITARLGHRLIGALGSALLIGALILLAATLGRSYWPIAVAMFVVSFGMRLVMITCAVDLLEALPDEQTSIGSAINDTAQELGNTIGVAAVGTIVASVVGPSLPDGPWGPGFADDFLGALRISFAVLAGLAAVAAAIGVRDLTDSTSVDEH